MGDEDSRTVWVGNFDPERTDEEILYELFLQAGPLHYVKIPKDKVSGKKKSFGFICYRHTISVPYAIELLNDIDVYGRNLRVQSRNLQQKQAQGQSRDPGGIHSLDPDFYGVQNFPAPIHPHGQQALLETPSMFTMPNYNALAMAQQQLALLNAYQPIPLAADPFLNAPRERHSDRHGSLNYARNNYNSRGNYSRNAPYQSDSYSRNSSYQRDNYSNNYRNTHDKSVPGGNGQHHQSQFDYGRLGRQSDRDHHYRPSHGNDYYRRHDDRHDRHRSESRSESRHSKYDHHRSSGRHPDHRNYR